MLKHQGKRTALITTTARSVMRPVLATHKLDGTFGLVVTGDEVKKQKPDPEGILFALEQLGVPKNRAVMLGDSDKDIGAARNAGIDSILFYPPAHEPFHSLDELQADGPTHTIRGWQELLDQVQ